MFLANLKYYWKKYLLNVAIITSFWVLILTPSILGAFLYKTYNQISYNQDSFSFISEIINPKNPTKANRILTCTQLQTTNLCFDSQIGILKNLKENPTNKDLYGYKANYQISDFDNKQGDYYLPQAFLKDFQTQNPNLIFEQRHLFYFKTKSEAIQFLQNTQEDRKVLNSSLNFYQVFNVVLEYQLYFWLGLICVLLLIFGANYFVLNLHFKEQTKSYKILQLLGFRVKILQLKQVIFIVFTSLSLSIFISLIGANFILQVSQKQIFRNLEPYNFSPIFKPSDIKLF